MTYVVPVPDWRVTLDGADVSPKIRPRLIALTVTDKRAGEADELELTLDDSDGKLALPKIGALLEVEIGWARGTGVQVGLVKKGRFKVDELGWKGNPDAVTVRGRSADFNAEIRNRRQHSWRETTIGQIVGDIAARNSLTPRCEASVAAIAVTAIAQSRESDLAFIRRLGRAHDAVATVKGGALIVSPAGHRKTATGKILPTGTIRRQDGANADYSYSVRNAADGVTASWHDREAGSQSTVTVGKSDGARRLARVYASRAHAEKAAKAALSKHQRDPAKFSFDLAFGRADLAPERVLQAVGFKPQIDAMPWLIVEVAHQIDGQGYVSKLQMEAAPQ